MKALPTSIVLAFAVAALPAAAQQSRPVLEPRTADAIVDHCLDYARQAGYQVAVAVFDHGGNLASFSNAHSPASGALAQWKGRSAAVYRVSTRQAADWNLPQAPMIATAEGGLPLFVGDVAVGGVGVSGAPSAFDAQCGTHAAEAAGLSVTPQA